MLAPCHGPLPNGHLAIFVATERGAVPAGVERFLSVDGSVPGAALCWDHHSTGEPINLDAMPDAIDASDLDGVGTTMADTDALASVVVVLLGGKARVPPAALELLRAASHRCDHLARHPGVTQEVDEAGATLHRSLSARFARAREGEERGRAFADLCRDLATRLARGEPLEVEAEQDGDRGAGRLLAEGRIRQEGQVAVVDLRGLGPVPPEAVYEHVGCEIAVFVDDHPRGGTRYTVGRHPARPGAPRDLGPALRALAAAEFAFGPPALGPDPVAGAENWGGRATVFGSPWNYGSRLGVEEVVDIVRKATWSG